MIIPSSDYVLVVAAVHGDTVANFPANQGGVRDKIGTVHYPVGRPKASPSWWIRWRNLSQVISQFKVGGEREVARDDLNLLEIAAGLELAPSAEILGSREFEALIFLGARRRTNGGGNAGRLAG